MRSFSVKTNDHMHVIYVSSLIRTVIGLHNLINNRINQKEAELEQVKKEKEEAKNKEEEAKKKVEAALGDGAAKEGESGADDAKKDKK